MAIYLVKPTTPAASLIGRYVVKLAPNLYGSVNSPMQVTGASGKSVTGVTTPRWYSAADSRWFYGTKPESVEGTAPSLPSEVIAMPTQVRSLYMACDTIEELDTLMDHSNKRFREFTEMLAASKAQLRAMATGGVLT
jgi:hypothetical protein